MSNPPLHDRVADRPGHAPDASGSSHGVRRTVAWLQEEINPNKTATLRPLGPVDVDALARAVDGIPDDQWDKPEDREANYNKGGAIRQAGHVIFRFCDKRVTPFHCYDLPVWDEWRDLLMPILTVAVGPYGYRNGFFPRIMLARLPGKSFIPPHVDGAPAASRPHKIHVPLATNPEAYMFVGDERFHLERGQAYEINNATRHAVANHGDTDRIHLIFEYLDADLQPFVT